MYNDIVTTVGNCNISFLVLDLSAAFHTIDNDNLFYILEKYVGIGGSALPLRLIRSYFSDRTQRVQIDGILSDFASLLCGVPQGSVLGPMQFCLYLLPLGAILRHHNIGYHIYADDTQLYISFKCKDPLESLTKLNMCISDIRVWGTACILKRIPRRNHITPVLRKVHWLRIHDIIIFYISLLTHNAINNTAPEYVCDLIRLNVKSTTIRTHASFDSCLLCVPPISKRVLIHYLIDLLCMLLQHCGMLLIRYSIIAI